MLNIKNDAKNTNKAMLYYWFISLSMTGFTLYLCKTDIHSTFKSDLVEQLQGKHAQLIAMSF